MSKKPSRILNDDTLFFGLDRNDIMALGAVFYGFEFIFRPFGKEYLSLVGTLVASIVMINIRLKFRRKIIRDTFRYFVLKILKGDIYNDPKTD